MSATPRLDVVMTQINDLGYGTPEYHEAMWFLLSVMARRQAMISAPWVTLSPLTGLPSVSRLRHGGAHCLRGVDPAKPPIWCGPNALAFKPGRWVSLGNGLSAWSVIPPGQGHAQESEAGRWTP